MDKYIYMQYQCFIFDSYDFDPKSGVLKLRYSFDDTEFFEETLRFDASRIQKTVLDNRKLLEPVLFAMHIMAGISYYKAVLPPCIQVRSGDLDKNQAAFWNKLYTQGLGEFFYQNNVDFRGLVDFPYNEALDNTVPKDTYPLSSSALLGVGGGKDTVVSAKRYQKEKGDDFAFICIGKSHESKANTAITFGKELLVVDRHIDPKLLEWNYAGAYNGHVPISAYNAFASLLLACLYGYGDIVYAMEKSANEANTILYGMPINHQYSKSQDFEKDFLQYLDAYIPASVHYQSNVRDKSELQIAGEFAHFPEFWNIITSCNANFIQKEDKATYWCGTCPKCAFAFLLFAPFIPKPRLIAMFGKNLLDDASLTDTYKELLWQKGHKPFECVGTYNEVNMALEMVQSGGEYKYDSVIKALQ